MASEAKSLEQSREKDRNRSAIFLGIGLLALVGAGILVMARAETIGIGRVVTGH